jgi:hypothetical protein
METNRIKIKIGSAEFEAEGPAEIIAPQFEAFMAAIAVLPKENPLGSTTAPANTPPAVNTPGSTAPPNGGVSQDVLDRVFKSGETLSLSALPSGDNAGGDAMLAMLYGYLKLKGHTTVTGTSLMKSAKMSGITIDRVDRAMNQPDYVLAAGVRKARRYQLNNRGIARAAEIINAILQ